MAFLRCVFGKTNERSSESLYNLRRPLHHSPKAHLSNGGEDCPALLVNSESLASGDRLGFGDGTDTLVPDSPPAICRSTSILAKFVFMAVDGAG